MNFNYLSVAEPALLQTSDIEKQILLKVKFQYFIPAITLTKRRENFDNAWKTKGISEYFQSIPNMSCNKISAIIIFSRDEYNLLS